MNEDAVGSPSLNRHFIPKDTPVDDALARLEIIADHLDIPPFTHLYADTPTRGDLAAEIRRCVEAIAVKLTTQKGA